MREEGKENMEMMKGNIEKEGEERRLKRERHINEERN
jgi:hypothetical protein